MPFARLAHAEPTSFVWEDEDGSLHHIRQGEGGEQGDPVLLGCPQLWSKGNVPCVGRASLVSGRHVHLVPTRAREASVQCHEPSTAD